MSDAERAQRLQRATTDAAELFDKIWPSLTEGGRRAVTAWLDAYVDLK